MSVLVSLKSDIEQVSQELKVNVDKLVEYETKVRVLKEQLHKLTRALEIMEGPSLSQPPTAEVHLAPSDPLTDAHQVDGKTPVPPPPPPKRRDLRPTCSACQGKMNRILKRVPSGMEVHMFQCESCNNESY